MARPPNTALRLMSSWSAMLCVAVLSTTGLLMLGATAAQASPRVELVTVEPGDAVWTRFGHVVLRVTDAATGRDDAYSYGYAPFDRPDFLWGYLRGESHFYVARQNWDRVLQRYRRYDRTVRRRPLNLSSEQTAELARRLEDNARPENREYRYDHLRDNCSSRVRDLLDEVTDGAIRRAASERSPDATYRDYTLRAGSGRPLVQAIFDLIGGPNQERRVDGWGQMYLPIYLEEVAATARVDDGRPLVGPSEVVYERRGPPPLSGDRFLSRRIVLATGLVVGLIFWWAGRLGVDHGWRRWVKRGAGTLLIAVGLVSGLVGLALTGLAVVSRVPDFAWNENVMVLAATDLGWVVTGGRWLFTGRTRVGRPFRLYTTLRVVGLAGYGAAKVAGPLRQDNWAFLGALVVVVVGLWLGTAAFGRPDGLTNNPG